MTSVTVLAAAAAAAALGPVSADSATVSPTEANRATHPLLPRADMKPVFAALPQVALNPADLDKQMASHRTIPFWRGQITSPLRTHYFTTTMVGSSPYAATPSRTVVPYVAIIARIHFADGTVLDPTQPGNCYPTPPSVQFLDSPLFQPAKFTSNGVDVSTGARGGTQLASAFQRANYWSVVQNTQYGVELRPVGAPIVVDVIAPAPASQVVSVTAQCPTGALTVPFGLMQIKQFDSIVQGLAAKYAQPDQLAIVMTYNFAESQGANCCTIGNHEAVAVAGGTQTIVYATFNDPGIFTTPIEDIYAWAHELAEWVDDPFYQQDVSGGRNNDETPRWGHVNQVSGCQDNLEVGDPLNGAALFEIQGAGGFLYHYQDLAFHDWFYRTPASGAGGLFSFQGVFTTDAGPKCT